MSPRPLRTQQYSNLPRVILDAAWRQIAELGAPALSLRGIARELGITAPAIYHYYPDCATTRRATLPSRRWCSCTPPLATTPVFTMELFSLSLAPEQDERQ